MPATRSKLLTSFHMGRPAKKYNPKDAKTVTALAQYGVPFEDIAATIEMSADVMTRLYAAELARGRAIANAKIGQKLFEKAMDGDTTALIFWAKCRMRWRESDSKLLEKAASEESAKKLASAMREAFRSVGMS